MYPLTQEHTRIAFENIKRLAPSLTVEVVMEGTQIKVSNPKNGRSEMFDAYLVGKNFMEWSVFADRMMLDEMVACGLLRKKTVDIEIEYVS